jgi:hypothetical protein
MWRELAAVRAAPAEREVMEGKALEEHFIEATKRIRLPMV